VKKHGNIFHDMYYAASQHYMNGPLERSCWQQGLRKLITIDYVDTSNKVLFIILFTKHMVGSLKRAADVNIEFILKEV
jgi:hypothetical protein